MSLFWRSLKKFYFFSVFGLSFSFFFLTMHYSFLVLCKALFFKFLKLSAPELIFFSFGLFVFFIFCGFCFLSRLGLYGTFFLGVLPAVLFWISLCRGLRFFLLKGCVASVTVSKWFKLTNLIEIKLDLFLDLISYSFMFLTTTIAVFVICFAFSYFRYEPNVEKLVLLLNAFVLSMVLLVISGNLILLFFGWEMIGLTSFLLINFWSTRVGTLKAAFKAYTFNKVSDISLFLAILVIYYSFGELNILKLSTESFAYNDYTLSCFYNIRVIELVSFFFLTAAFIKSAQVGFHVWLPDSMEAPVPASALIHSATLVSAGIFLSLRFQPLFELSQYFHTVVPIVGSVTAFIGGFGAFFQTDLKRVLAYSTISHCGFLFFLTAFNCVEYTVIYLYVHGFFKASSFLCVGNLIRFSKNYQDVRRMGGYWKYLPFELYALAFCLLNLSGLPFFFGFLIKHFLFLSFDFFFFNCVAFGFIFLSAFCGLFYSFKVFFYVFFDSKKARSSIYFSYSNELTASVSYSNTTLASAVAILLLAAAGLTISFFFFSWFYSLRVYSLVSPSVYFGKCGLFSSYNFDLSLLFNFKYLNTVVCIFFFFLNFFKWTRGFFYSFELFFFWLSGTVLLLSVA